jgi:hypothetical protein
MIPQKLDIIRRLESGYTNIGLTIYVTEKQDDQLQSLMLSSESVKGFCKPQTLKTLN